MTRKDRLNKFIAFAILRVKNSSGKQQKESKMRVKVMKICVTQMKETIFFFQFSYSPCLFNCLHCNRLQKRFCRTFYSEKVFVSFCFILMMSLIRCAIV